MENKSNPENTPAVGGWWNHISKLFTPVEADKALQAEPVPVTVDMANWCYPGDVNLWHSGYASTKGDYQSVESSVSSPANAVLFAVCKDQVCASMIYTAMMHMPVLPSFLDSWTCVMVDPAGLLTFSRRISGEEEHANCNYGEFIAGVKTEWTRVELEALWADMGPRPSSVYLEDLKDQYAKVVASATKYGFSESDWNDANRKVGDILKR